jgi:hypothetical protein
LKAAARFLQEGADALDEVLGLAGELLSLSLGVQLAVPVSVEAVPDQLADRAQRHRAIGQFLGYGRRRGQQLTVRHAAIDQAPFQRRGGRDLVAQQHHLHGPRLADQARQQIGRAAVGHEADAAEGLQEIGALAGHDDVAHQRDRAADPGRRPLTAVTIGRESRAAAVIIGL